MTTGSLYGEQSFRVVSLFGTAVHTNVEAIAIILATGFAASSLPAAAMIVGSFMLGTGLHLGCHWLVALSFGKGIDRMVLTRAGPIDYAGAPPRPLEGILRMPAGPTINARVGPARALRIAAWISVVLLALMGSLGIWLLQAVLVYVAATIAHDNWNKHLRVTAPAA